MASLHSLLAALLLVGAAGAPPFRSPAELAAPADLPTNLLQFAETAVGESDRSVGRESLDLQLAPDATDELLPYLGLRLDASGLSTHIEYADCHARMSIAPVLALMITCAVFFVFDAACLWDGCYVARCLDRPLFARLFSRKGAGKASDTADTGPSDNFDALTVAQLTLIILGAFTLDVLFTAVATFLPGRASVRGISGSTLGLMFAAYPVGQAVAALVAPAMLSQAWLDPVVGSRKALLGAALVVSAAGVIDEYATDATTFIAGVVGTRILQGFASGMSEVMVDAAVYTVFGPKTAAFVVSSMIAVRLLACALGPTLGGHLYELGCWALPFFACACLLLVDALLQLLCIGRRASGALETTGKKASPLTILKALSLPAGMKIIFDAIAWIHMAGFEVTLQPFLGEAPYNQTPGQIGNLLLCVTLVNSIAYVAAPPFAVSVGATYVMPITASICFGLSMLVGPSPLLPQIPQTMPIQYAAWSSSAFFFALNFPCGLVVWPSIVDEMGFSTEQVAGVLGGIQVLTSAVGGITGPLLFATAGDYVSYPWVYTIDAFTILIVTEIYGITLMCRYRHEHPPACCNPDH